MRSTMPAISSWREINVPVPVFQQSTFYQYCQLSLSLSLPTRAQRSNDRFLCMDDIMFRENKGMADCFERRTAI